MCPSKINSLIPLMRRRRQLFYQNLSCCKYYTTLKFFVNITKKSETMMMFISFASSYVFSYRCLFFSHYVSLQVW